MLDEWSSLQRRKELGQRLQTLREQAGITQLALSEMAGCSKNYLSSVERGKIKLTVPLLLEYCSALHKAPNEVLGYEDGKKHNSELMSIIETFSKEQYEQAVKILKAIQQ